MRKIIALFGIVLLLVACEADNIYSERTVFSDLLWSKTVQPSFTFEIKKEQNYRINLELRLIYDYPYKNIKMDMLFTGENGEKQSFPIDFIVQEERGVYNGDIMGDFIDYKETLISDTVLAAGKYTIVLDQLMEENALPFVNEVGIVVEEVKQE